MDAEGLTIKGWEHLEQGEARRALALAEQAVTADPTDSEAHRLRMLAYFALGDHRSARRDADILIKTGADDPAERMRDLAMSGSIAEALDDWERAEKDFAAASDLASAGVKDPGADSWEDYLAQLRGSRGKALAMLGRYADAVDSLSEAIMTGGSKEAVAEWYMYRSMSHHEVGEHKDALDDAEAVLELQPTDLFAITTVAEELFELDRYEEAASKCSFGIAIADEDDEVVEALLKLRVRSDFLSGNDEAGFGHLFDAIERVPTDADLRAMRARLLLNTTHSHDAVDDLYAFALLSDDAEAIAELVGEFSDAGVEFDSEKLIAALQGG